jgi:hypothetical protein
MSTPPRSFARASIAAAMPAALAISAGCAKTDPADLSRASLAATRQRACIEIHQADARPLLQEQVGGGISIPRRAGDDGGPTLQAIAHVGGTALMAFQVKLAERDQDV